MKAVIFDIDGVLADQYPRVQRFLRKEGNVDWKGFYYQQKYDDPIKHSIIFLKAMRQAGYKVAIVTGRPETYRKETTDWLKHDAGLDGYYDALLMRPEDDYRPPQAHKREALNQLRDMGWDVEMAVEDQPETVEMFIGEGLMTFITPSYFFWTEGERGREEPPEETQRKIDELAIAEAAEESDPWWRNDHTIVEALKDAVDEPMEVEVSAEDAEMILSDGWDAPEGRTHSEEERPKTMWCPGWDGEADFCAEILAESDQDSNNDDLLH